MALVILFVAAIVLALQGPLTQSIASSMGVTSARSFSGGIDTLIIVLLLASIVTFFVGVILARLDYGNMTFTFETYDIVIRKGLITRRESSIPYHHIQKVHIERSPIQQMFRVSRVILATSEDSKDADGSIILEPIDADLADDVRQMIENRMSVDVIEDRDKFTKPDAPVAPATPTTHEA